MAADGGFEWPYAKLADRDWTVDPAGRNATGWPAFANGWYDGEYPTGRGRQRPILGWQCSGCGRGYAPHVRECAHCGPKTEQATSTNCCGPNGCEDAER